MKKEIKNSADRHRSGQSCRAGGAPSHGCPGRGRSYSRKEDSSKFKKPFKRQIRIVKGGSNVL